MPAYEPPGPIPPPPLPPTPPDQNGNTVNPATAGFNLQSQTSISPAFAVPSQLISQPTVVTPGTTTQFPTNGNVANVPAPPVNLPASPAMVRRPKPCGCGCGGGNQSQNNLTAPKEVSLTATSFASHGPLPGTGILSPAKKTTMQAGSKPCGCGGTSSRSYPMNDCHCGCIPCCCNEKPFQKRRMEIIPSAFSPQRPAAQSFSNFISSPKIQTMLHTPFVNGTPLNTKTGTQVLGTPNPQYGIDFSGKFEPGPLLTSVEVVPIFWGDMWWPDPSDESTINPLVKQIHDFYDWFLTSPVMDLLSQDYSVGTQIIKPGHRALGNFIITGNDPPSWFQDNDIQIALGTWIAPNNVFGIPSPTNGKDTQQLYVVYLPDGVTESYTRTDVPPLDPPIDLGESCPTGNWFGYHAYTTTNDGHPYYYSVVAFPCNASMECYNLRSQIDVLTKVSSHELCDAITDPINPIGWVDLEYNEGEIAEICGNGCPDHNGWVHVSADNGNTYVICKIWSRTQGTCTIFPSESRITLDYSVKDAPAIASFGIPSGNPLVIAWTEQVAPSQKFPVFGSYPFGRIFIMNNLTTGVLDFPPPIILQDSSNPNPEFSIDSPALSYGPQDNFYIAWTGNDPGHTINLMSASWIDLSSWGGKLQLSEYSPYGPALAYGNGYLFIAWAGTDNRINIRRSSDGVTWNDSDKVILQQWTIDSPSLAFVNNTLYLLFRSSSSDQFFIMTSTDSGKSFSDFTTIPNQTTDYTPAMTLDGNDLVLAWRDSTSPHNINILRADNSSSNPLNSFGTQAVFPDTSNGSVALTTNLGKTYIAWAGTDSENQLNIWRLPPSF
jgi:hypothetical protein